MDKSQNSQAMHIVGADQFEKEVKKSEVPVLVDFFAPWCGPCQMAAPVMDKLAGDYADKAKVVKVDVDESDNRSVAMEHQVMSIPTVMVYKDGEIHSKNIGFIGEQGYQQMLDSALE